MAFSLMVADWRLPQTEYLRVTLSTLISPIRWMVQLPNETTQWALRNFSSRSNLIEENAVLKARLFVLERKSQKLAQLEVENERLRTLLKASQALDETILAAELISVDPDPFTHQVILNKGRSDGVFVGQPVLDAYGMMGQVIQVDLYSSRVLLVADTNHAVPVQVNRNGYRSIAVGNGSLDSLDLIYVPETADIKVGDLLVTSGLGGRFPVGYPVATVSSIEHDPGEAFARVRATPSAQLDRTRHVILVFTEMRN